MPRFEVSHSNPTEAARRICLHVRDYDLAATLQSGQAFRWRERCGDWESVVNGRWVRLRQADRNITAETAVDMSDWRWLADYLQTDTDIAEVIRTFPEDVPMRAAVRACRGLRLLRQPPWECLASFILSSTKQIVQIQEIVRLLCERFGNPVAVPEGVEPMFAFPTPERLAACSEAELRGCKMGFRAPYLLGTARMIAGGGVSLDHLRNMSVAEARERLLAFPGVGRKIADCVLLFAYGFQEAFPIDVWVERALRELYFPQKRRLTLPRLREFCSQHFGPNAGYAQQYLFHYMRTSPPQALAAAASATSGAKVGVRFAK